MSGKRRIVTIPVTDPKVTSLRVHPFRELKNYPGSGEFIGWHWVPVPSDDRLGRLVDEVCGLASCHVGETMFGGVAEESYRDIAALRAAFQLGEEE